MTAINNKAKLFSLCMVLFIDAIGSGLILPILPELFFNPEYGLLQGYAFHNTNVIYGITLAVFPLASLFGKYLFGALSDHVGRKKTIIAGLSIILLSYLLSIIAIMIDSIPLFILARFITGFGAGTYTAVYAMIADMSKTIERKMTNFKWPALATVLGFIVGPILGGASGIAHGQLSLVIPFAIGFILTLLNIFKAKASLEENVVVQGSHHFSPLFFFKESYHYLLSIKNKKLIKYLLGSYLVFQFAIGLYIQSISLYLSEYCHFTTNQIGFFYVVMGGAILLNTLVIQKRIQDRSSPLEITTNISLVGIVVFGILEISRLLLEDNIMITFIVSFVVYILLNVSVSVYTALLSEHTSSSEQGRIISLSGQAYSLTWFLASLFIGVPRANDFLLLICITFLFLSLLFIRKLQ